MAAEIVHSALQILRLEEEDAFATENAVPALEDIRAIDPVLTRTQQMHRRRHRLQRLSMHPDFNFGRKEGGLSFGHELVGATTPCTAAAAPADDSLGLLLKTSFGNTYKAAGSNVVGAPAPSTTAFSVTPAHGARFRAGTAILVAGTGPAGENEMSVIKSVSTDAITLEFALSSAPAEGADVWNCYAYYIDPSQYATLQGQLVGEAVADRWFACGIYGPVTFENILQLDEVATCKFEFAVTQWDEDIVAAGCVAGVYDEAYPAGTSSEMDIVVVDENTTTRTLVSMSALDINPNLVWTPHHARGASEHEHCVRVRQTGGAAVGSGPTVKMTVDIDSDFVTDWEAKTKKMICAMSGRTAGSAWAIIVPRAQIVQAPERGAHSEMTAYNLSFEACENDAGPDSSGAQSSSYLMRSPIVLCRI